MAAAMNEWEKVTLHLENGASLMFYGRLFSEAVWYDEYSGVLLQGAGVTLLLALVGTFIGCVIGLAVGIVQTIPEDPNAGYLKNMLIRGVKSVLSAYVEIFRGTPMIVSRYTNDSTGNGCILWCDEPV